MMIDVGSPTLPTSLRVTSLSKHTPSQKPHSTAAESIYCPEMATVRQVHVLQYWPWRFNSECVSWPCADLDKYANGSLNACKAGNVDEREGTYDRYERTS